MHALEDRLIPVLYGATSETSQAGVDASGTGRKVEWRTWWREGRRVALVVNPRSTRAKVDLAAVLQLGEGESARRWDDCAPLDALTLDPYAVAVVEAAP